MRFKRAMAVVLGVAAMVTLAGVTPGVAQGNDRTFKGVERERGVSSATNGGQSLLEINSAGELVYWQRSGVSYSRQVRGWGWQNTQAITSLDAQHFIEIKGDGRLAKWSWNGGQYTQSIIGWGWDNARLITGISSGQFIEINKQGELAYWTLDGSNGLTKAVRGWGWQATRSITGLDPYLFIEIKGDALNSLSWWVDEASGLREYPETNSDNRWIRLIAGADADHFVVIAVDGTLVEFAWNAGTERWVGTERGWGWQGTRLIG
ncbi:hypothetical protein GCM10022243_02940 [Saccharothrix violaceirubra]|uniref:Tachylectin n=1 Tax=Saccharothrix violaceirubra TaxID=413306 RepID=A0A7W7SZW8_9PSEU|nr:hypothetical protein [Saccharothrix violaceirubra]MBB4964042.1 hypothetical protein [Saccharothrix violaceirubra]